MNGVIIRWWAVLLRASRRNRFALSEHMSCGPQSPARKEPRLRPRNLRGSPCNSQSSPRQDSKTRAEHVTRLAPNHSYKQLLQLRMLQMKSGRFLVGSREGQQFRVAV